MLALTLVYILILLGSGQGISKKTSLPHLNTQKSRYAILQLHPMVFVRNIVLSQVVKYPLCKSVSVIMPDIHNAV